MKENEVRELADKGTFQNTLINGIVNETHISWVILSRRNVFKIKKPLKPSFLDYSTLALRKENCEKELLLNRRFSDIYISVLPVRVDKGKSIVGGQKGEIIDYAVHMRRLMTAKKMDNVLKRKKVGSDDMESLAGVVGQFHQNATKIFKAFNLGEARKTFNDIASIRDVVAEKLEPAYIEIIDQSLPWSDEFLKTHAGRIQQRIELGFQRDVHGDLHSGNIFLYKEPVLFDCIEFNDSYRQIDVLYEIAFFCMDLEGFHQKHLVKPFLLAYDLLCPAFESKEDDLIFNYYKCLRANIRAKVRAMRTRQDSDENQIQRHLGEVRKYLLLMKNYMNG